MANWAKLVIETANNGEAYHEAVAELKALKKKRGERACFLQATSLQVQSEFSRKLVRQLRKPSDPAVLLVRRVLQTAVLVVVLVNLQTSPWLVRPSRVPNASCRSQSSPHGLDFQTNTHLLIREGSGCLEPPDARQQ